MAFHPPAAPDLAKVAAKRAAETAAMTGEIARLAAHPSIPPALRAAILAEPDPAKLLALVETHVDAVLADLAARYPGIA